MCVIAGYLGKDQAAPVLLEMLRREEGLAGGFYTGIVTLHEGVLHHAKVVGDLDVLLEETPALRLPGTIGLAHSRTASGGGRAWAHPFIDTFGKLAYIANGAMGLYRDRVDFTGEARALLERGYTFSSLHDEPVARYPMLPDGRCVHFSDILCQAIAAAYEGGSPGTDRLLAAARATYQRLPGSLVGLCLHADRPDEIVGIRHNKPMDVGRLRDGSLVMASSALAFPSRVDWQMRLPALCGARFGREGTVSIVPFDMKGLIPLGPPPSAAAVEETVVARLRQAGRMTSHELIESTVPLWPADTLNEKEVVAYGLLSALLAEGRIELRDERVPGVDNQGTAPRTVAYWRQEGAATG